MSPKKICIVVFSRANYGSIKSLIEEISKDKKFELVIVAGGSAMLNKFGSVSEIIKKDGFKIAEEIFFVVEGETPETMVKSTAIAMVELSSFFKKNKPDLVLTVGDRYETMATVLSSVYMNIPVAHTMGGEISGTIDESIRHAITKFSHLHFAATKKAAENILKMGENKKNIFMVGCPRIDLIKQTISKKINKKVFENIIFSSGVGNRFDIINDDFIVVMQHPVTTEYLDAGKQIQNTLIATSKIKMKKIFFWPNVDAGSESISLTIRKWREDNLDNDFYFIKNLETQHFYNLLNLSKCLVGNSSAGIRDAGYLGLPVVNIGTRQNAREHGINVLHANNNYKDIYKKVLISTKKKYKKNYIYGDGNTAQRIVKILRNIKKIEIQKKLSYK